MTCVIQRYARANGSLAAGADDIHRGQQVDRQLRPSRPATAAEALALIDLQLHSLGHKADKAGKPRIA